MVLHYGMADMAHIEFRVSAISGGNLPSGRGVGHLEITSRYRAPELLHKIFDELQLRQVQYRGIRVHKLDEALQLQQILVLHRRCHFYISIYMNVLVWWPIAIAFAFLLCFFALLIRHEISRNR